MAIQTLNTIKNWFKTGLKPSQEQFWDTWDSFRHKNEKLPLQDIENLEITLNSKAEKSELDAHKTNVNAHSELFNTKENKANKGIANGYAPLNGFTKLAAQYLDIINDLVSGGSNSLLSAEQGKILQINKENKSQKGAANGYASLGSDSIVPKSQSQGSNLSYDSINGIISLIDGRGETHSIDLPIENLFQNASYNNDTQNLTLITNGGGKIDINLSTLVDLPEIVLSNTNPTALPSAGQKLYIHSDNGNYWMNVNGNWTGVFMPVSQTEKDNWNSKFTRVDVSASQAGIINNTELQELGGVDKTINGVRIGRGTGNSSGSTILGNNSLINNTTGYYNTAIGYNSLNKNTTGHNCTAVGYGSLYKNTSPYYNTAVGSYSLYNNTIGTDNTAIGGSSLENNISGYSNTGIGKTTLSSNTSGYSNTAVGSYTLRANITGSNNTAVGSYALSQCTGSLNIGLGFQAGNGITTGKFNTIIGYQGMLNADDSKLVIISDGASNIAIRKESDNRLIAPMLTQALIISGGETSLVNKGYTDNMGAVVNPTTTTLTSNDLNSAYPNALVGFRAHCKNIATGGLIYEKTSNGWLQYAVAVVA